MTIQAEKHNIAISGSVWSNNSSEPNRIPTWKDVWPQVTAALIVASANAQGGICMGLSGVLIPQLAVDSNIMGFDRDVASWIAGLFSISAIIGALCGPIMDKIGRKKTLIACQIPVLINWIVMSTTYYSIWPLYVARLLAGLGTGLSGVAQFVYIAEISHSHYRAPLVIMVSLTGALGILVVSILGVALEWHVACIIFGLIVLINTLGIFMVPESPYWMSYFKKNSPEEIQKELRKLNHPEWLFQNAWSEIQASDSKEADNLGTIKSGPFVELISVVKDRQTFIPLILVTFIFIFQQASGIYLFVYYSASIFASLGRTTLGDYEISVEAAVMLMGALRVITTAASCALSRVASKNAIMIYSGVVTSLSAASVAVFMTLNDVKAVDFQSVITDLPPAANELNSLLAVVSLLIFVAAGGMGLLVFPWTLPSDLFPTATRAFGNTFSVFFGNLIIFGTVKTFPYWLDFITLPVIFGGFAFFAFTFAIFVFFFLPNTSNKTFEELANTFVKK